MYKCSMELCTGCWDLGSIAFNTLKPGQNGRHFADDISKGMFLNENWYIIIQISFRFVSKCPIFNIPALVQIMAWRRPGDKPSSESMMVIVYASLGLIELKDIMHMVIFCFVFLVDLSFSSHPFPWCIYLYHSGLSYWHWIRLPRYQWSNPGPLFTKR